MPDSIEVSDEAGIRIIRMNRPEKKNALTQPMYAAMTRALARGARRRRDPLPRHRRRSRRLLRRRRHRRISRIGAERRACGRTPSNFSRRIAHNRKPLVAAVNGLAVGIGVTMLFHCDHVVASADATFTTPFLKLALIPEAASSLLAPMRMGYARAFSMLVMGRTLSAAEAKEAGIVNSVVEAAAVDGVALKAAREIAALPAGAVAVSRRADARRP